MVVGHGYIQTNKDGCLGNKEQPSNPQRLKPLGEPRTARRLHLKTFAVLTLNAQRVDNNNVLIESRLPETPHH